MSIVPDVSRAVADVASRRPSSADRRLIFFFRFIGGVTMLAFVAAVMPQKWIIEIGEELGFDPFPDVPLTYYLARNLSLLYGFVGLVLFVIASDLNRYRPLVFLTGAGTVMFGILQMVVDALAGLPLGWVIGEGLWTFLGGCLILELDRRARPCVADAVE